MFRGWIFLRPSRFNTKLQSKNTIRQKILSPLPFDRLTVLSEVEGRKQGSSLFFYRARYSWIPASLENLAKL